MNNRIRLVSARGGMFAVAFLCLQSSLLAQVSEVPLRFYARANEEHQVIAGLLEETAAKLPMGRLAQEQGEAIMVVSLLSEDKKKAGPAMLGKYERTADRRLIFTPRFPFVAGQTYRATWKAIGQAPTTDFVVPPAAAKAPPKVVKIYPSASVLPANHLRFYIFFDRPMRGGKDLFKQIALVDDKGKEIADPWLLDEIWDEENNCLILFIHPGRIKWGVELRELMGPVLYDKRQYSLVVRGELTDIDGNKIGTDFVKKFRTTPEDRVRVDLSQWKLEPAIAGTSERLIVTLPKSIDHRSLQRFLSVTDAKGQRVAGEIEIGEHEKSWAFSPKANWREGTYRLEVSGDLEDACGNTPLRPFDLDLKAPKLTPQRLRIPFKCPIDN